MSSAAEELQRNADGLASGVQRNTETSAQELQDRFNKASAKAEATARDLRQGTVPETLLAGLQHLSSRCGCLLSLPSFSTRSWPSKLSTV